MKHFKLIALAMLVVLAACQKNSVTPEDSKNHSGQQINTLITYTPCGTETTVDLLAGQHIQSGTVTVGNDANNLYVTFTTVNGWMLNHTHLYAGDCNLIPVTNSGNPQIGQFPWQQAHQPNITTYTYVIPLAGLDPCICVAAHAEVILYDQNGNQIQAETAWGAGTGIGGNSWAMKFDYCLQACTPPPPLPCLINPGDYRTQTQGGWGATPNGGNPGAYLHANFAAAFPAGLTVGCNNGYTLSLTSASSVTAFLPQGGPAGVLTQSFVDPGQGNISVFAGQLVAASLSVGFDLYDPNFGSAPTYLGDLVITNGVFQGWSVNQLLAEANLAFGSCSSYYSISDLNTALTGINENFVDGTMVGTFLTCP